MTNANARIGSVDVVKVKNGTLNLLEWSTHDSGESRCMDARDYTNIYM